MDQPFVQVFTDTVLGNEEMGYTCQLTDIIHKASQVETPLKGQFA